MACQVMLLSYTPDPDRLVAASARLCYSDSSAQQLQERLPDQKVGGFLDHLRSSGHLSTFEHASFSFAVDGISRVCSHQLVRHRHASYSQQSQRYVAMESPSVVVPPSVRENPESEKAFLHYAEAVHRAYKDMIAQGIPREDARYLLPHAWETRLVVTMNARELHHFFRLRLCRRAQWEIRELARLMLREVRKVAPGLFQLAGPDCVTLGRCGESRPCGNPFSGMEELLLED